MLGTFKGSSHKALEVEAAVLLLEVKFEKAYNNYSLRILLFYKDYLINKTSPIPKCRQQTTRRRRKPGPIKGLTANYTVIKP